MLKSKHCVQSVYVLALPIETTYILYIVLWIPRKLIHGFNLDGMRPFYLQVIAFIPIMDINSRVPGIYNKELIFNEQHVYSVCFSKYLSNYV